jgi:hypothetical protein
LVRGDFAELTESDGRLSTDQNQIRNVSRKGAKAQRVLEKDSFPNFASLRLGWRNFLAAGIVNSNFVKAIETALRDRLWSGRQEGGHHAHR